MKHYMTILCACLAITVGTLFISSCADKADKGESTGTLATEAPNDGMYFCSHSVVDNIFYGTEDDGAYYLIYDDADQGMYYEAIRVTKKTYFSVLAAMETSNELHGYLQAVQEYETLEYELNAERY